MALTPQSLVALGVYDVESLTDLCLLADDFYPQSYYRLCEADLNDAEFRAALLDLLELEC